MSLSGTHRYPLELLVNYWEIQPSLYGKYLDDLIRRGAKHLATFVPWQALESDITHSLSRFLQAVAERKLTVSLLLSPELGVHYPNCGLPKDLVSKDEHLAKLSDGSPITSNLPPGFFPLPSLYSQEYKKRYFSFLSKMDGILADQMRTNPNLPNFVNLVLSGSFWKYYRSPQDSAFGAFDSSAGDFSNGASLAYRQHMDQFYQQREFIEGSSIASPLAGNRWKDRAQEENNRAFFHQQSEEVYRNRSYQQLRRKSVNYSLEEAEIFTPEADPSLYFARFLGAVGPQQKNLTFNQLSSLIDQCAQRISLGSQDRARPRLHWTRMAGFGGGLGKGLSDAEKQYLILKSLLLMGSEGGSVLVSEKDWFSLSPSFRTRAEMISHYIEREDLKALNRSYFWTPHLWSGAHPLWQDFAASGTKLISSLDTMIREPDARLLVVDPRTVITREAMLKMATLARAGKVVALSRSPLFTESARIELEKLCAGTRRLEIDLGLSYQLHVVGTGRVVLFDVPSSVSRSSLTTFSQALLAIAEIDPLLEKVTEGFEVISLQKRLGGFGIFVFNSKAERATGEVTLRQNATISDLGRALAGISSPKEAALETRVLPLEVSGLGVIPLSLEISAPDLSGHGEVQPETLGNLIHTQMDKNGTDLRLV